MENLLQKLHKIEKTQSYEVKIKDCRQWDTDDDYPRCLLVTEEGVSFFCFNDNFSGGLTPENVVGATVSITLKSVEKDGQTFVNVVSVAPKRSDKYDDILGAGTAGIGSIII